MALSTGGIARMVERRVETYGTIAEAEMLRYLERYGLSEDHAREGIRLGLVRGKFILRTGDGGESELRRQVVLAEVL
jgi:hypothetical protein